MTWGYYFSWREKINLHSSYNIYVLGEDKNIRDTLCCAAHIKSYNWTYITSEENQHWNPKLCKTLERSKLSGTAAINTSPPFSDHPNKQRGSTTPLLKLLLSPFVHNSAFSFHRGGPDHWPPPSPTSAVLLLNGVRAPWWCLPYWVSSLIDLLPARITSFLPCKC